jgi:Fe-S-cluster containining protein
MNLPPEEQVFVRQMLEKLMELGIGAVYGDEDENEKPALVDCEPRLKLCRAVCCSFHFALTKKEAQGKKIAYNQKKPFFIKRENDGYCTHLERSTLRCSIWTERPERCRKYDCRTDPKVWENWQKGILKSDALKHLSTLKVYSQ